MIKNIANNKTVALTAGFGEKSGFKEIWDCVAPQINLYKLIGDNPMFVIPTTFFQKPKNAEILGKWFVAQAENNELPVTYFIRNYLDDDSVFDGYNDVQIEAIIAENILLFEASAGATTTSFYGADFGVQKLYEVMSTRLTSMLATGMLYYIENNNSKEASLLRLVRGATRTPPNTDGYISNAVFDVVLGLTNNAAEFYECAKLKDCMSLSTFISNIPNAELMNNIVATLRQPAENDNSTYIKACIEFIGENPSSMSKINNCDGSTDKGLLNLLKNRDAQYKAEGVNDVSEVDVINAIYRTEPAEFDASSSGLDRNAIIEDVVYKTIAAMIVDSVCSRLALD